MKVSAEGSLHSRCSIKYAFCFTRLNKFCLAYELAFAALEIPSVTGSNEQGNIGESGNIIGLNSILLTFYQAT